MSMIDPLDGTILVALGDQYISPPSPLIVGHQHLPCMFTMEP